MLLALLMGLSFAPDQGGWSIELPEAWSEVQPSSLEGALLQARSDTGTIWIRELDLSETLEVSHRKLRGVDLQGAASADRIARLVQRAQD